MAVYEVFAHPEVRRYKSAVVSKASVFQVFCVLLTFIVPILIAYRSGGFWFKEDTYKESPMITFKHELIVTLGLQSGDILTYSTFQNYNQLQEQRLRIPFITSRESDNNNDGRSDQLTLTVEMPLQDTENVVTVQLVLFFYYKLLKYSSFHMESLAFISASSPLPGGHLYATGELRLHLKQPLSHKGIDARYNGSLIDSASTFAEDYSLKTLRKKYISRNVTTRLEPSNDIDWMAGRGPGVPFVIETDVMYPAEETITYYPGFWYMIKWGWIQYLSILLIFLYIFERVKIFAFRNQLVTTIVERSTDTAKSKLL